MMLKRDVFHNDLVRYIWRAAIPHISLMGRAWAAKTKFLQNNQLSLKDSMQQLIHYLRYQKLLQKNQGRQILRNRQDLCLRCSCARGK